MKALAAALTLATAAAQAVEVFCPAEAPANVRLAAREIRRYVYLCTRELPVIKSGGSGPGIVLKFDPELGPQSYRLKSEGSTLAISGGSDVAVLYGAYAFAEALGVRFSLHGDAVPDERIAFTLPQLNETRTPLFDLRGIQPFHDFMEGPDWWNAGDYKAYAAQLVKMRMNFIGFHSYPWFKPWAHVPPEPGVWIGLPEDVDAQGRVKASYPASWANTARPGPVANNAWGHLPGPIANFSAGASLLFDRDDYGAEVMRGLTPWPRTPEDCNELFNRAGDLFGEAFRFARRLGVKVCVGTETPFWVPDELRAKLKAQGRKPEDPAVLRELCQGMFTRIQRAHPVDYFWLWTPERALDPARTLSDMAMIHAVAGEAGVPVAISGWGWLAHQFAAFDKVLPKDIAFSCINEHLGFAPVTPAFGQIQDRPRWCIPWMEDDTDMTAPQLFAGRVSKDAADAKRFGCTGLIGIHWRTKIIAPQLAMLARCGWSLPDGTGTLREVIGSEGTVAPRIHPQRAWAADDFYADWCRAQFGRSVAPRAAEIFARVDGRLPRPACWALGGHHGQSAGPGIVGDADPRPWETVAAEYAFVDELAALRPSVAGAGNLDRFDYWLGQFQYLKAMGRLRCTRSEFDQAVYRAEAAIAAEQATAGEAALRARRQLVADWSAMMTHLLETVSTPGELGTVANLELHTRLSGGYLTNFDARLEKLLGRPLPADCAVSGAYSGRPRLVVPTVRSIATPGEALTVKIMVLDRQPVKSVVVRVRPLGRGEWRTIEAGHLGRAVYQSELPAAADDVEYHIEAETTGGARMRWPAGAPEQNQTVVLAEDPA